MSHKISLEEAINLTSRYRREKDQILNPEFAGKNVLPIAETFDRSAFEELLSTPGCVSIRAYFGMDENRNIKLLFVAANDKDADLLPGQDEGASIEDIGQRCPPVCPVASPLNS